MIEKLFEIAMTVIGFSILVWGVGFIFGSGLWEAFFTVTNYQCKG